MYEPPIQMIVTEMQQQIEEQEGRILMKAVRGVGFDVDRHELMRALAYDRDQYRKGYNDAMRNAVPLDKLCEWLVRNCEPAYNIDDIHNLKWPIDYSQQKEAWMKILKKLMKEE